MSVRVISDHRKRGGLLLAIAACVVMTVVGAPTASAADFTWARSASDNLPGGQGALWSTGANWAGGTAPSGTVGSLVFPAAACTATACPIMADDVAGLTAATVSIRAPRGVTQQWNVAGAPVSGSPYGPPIPLTLTSGLDLAVTSAPGLNDPQQGLAGLFLPIVLGADNTWSIDGGTLFGQGYFGVSGDHSLTISLAHSARLQLANVGIEVGPLTITGNGNVILSDSAPSGYTGDHVPSLDANGHPVTVSGGAALTTYSNNNNAIHVGALKVDTNAMVSPGSELATASATLDRNSTLKLDNSQGSGTLDARLTSTGAIDLGGATLDFNDRGLCESSRTMLTIVSAQGPLTGTLKAPSVPAGTFQDLPDGTVVRGFKCSYRINYTAHTVTITKATAPPSGTGTGTATPVPTYALPTPTPTPKPGSGQPSQAAVLAALKSVGRPAAGTTLAKLLAKGAAVVPFAAPSTGLLKVTWSATGSGTRAAAAKRTTIATATKTVAAAGKVNIKIKLTKAGKKALKKAKRAKRAVKVTSNAGFTPTGGTKTTATTHFS